MADAAAALVAGMRGIAAAALAAILAGCAASPAAGLRDAAPPSEIERAACVRYRPRDAASCERFRLPDRASQIAYGTCLEYNRIDPERCKNLRLAFEADLRAYLEAAPAAANRGSAAEGAASEEIAREELPALYHTAQELYDATSRDAETFAAALLIPEVRQKIQDTLHQQLSDDALRQLARHARAESLYWYEYMKGLEAIETRSN